MLYQKDAVETQKALDKSLLNLEDIITYAREVDLDDVRDVLERQIDYNTAISDEGLQNRWGAGVGQTVLEEFGDDVKWRAIARAAAGSDAA